MVLVDTSVWIDHLRKADAELSRLLNAGRVLVHPCVIGELACGNLRGRTGFLALLSRLPHSRVANDHEALELIELRRLAGRGIGWVDVHLLASSLLTACDLWTRDRALRQAAVDLGMAAQFGG